MNDKGVEIGSVDKAFEDYITQLQAVLCIDPLNEENYWKIEEAIKILRSRIKALIQQKPEIARIERMLKWFIIRYVEGSNKAPYVEISDVLKEIK